MVRTTLVVLPAALAALAYSDIGTSFLWAGAAALVGAVLTGEKTRLLLMDWAIVLLLLYEIPSLTFSRYASNGLPSAKVVCGSAICYFLEKKGTA